MGLDQTLNWICKPPKAYVSRLRKKDLRERMVLYGSEYMSEEDYSLPAYKYIRKYMIPEEVYISEMNWELLKYDCGVPYDVQICGLGPGYVLIGKAANDVDVKKFDINPYDKRYEKIVLRRQYFFYSIEVYRWRKNYKIQNLFNKSYPDEWDDYENAYEVVYGGYYPIRGLLKKMKTVDPDFAEKYHEGTEDVFFESNW